MFEKLKRFYFYNIRLQIGRLEKCTECNRFVWNRRESLYDSLYHNERDDIYCNKCKGDIIERFMEPIKSLSRMRGGV